MISAVNHPFVLNGVLLQAESACVIDSKNGLSGWRNLVFFRMPVRFFLYFPEEIKHD